MVGKQRKGLTASNDLRGQNEYAYCTITTILWGVFEINFFDKCSGFSVKSEQTDRQTDRQTDTFPLYIYRYERIAFRIFSEHAQKLLKSCQNCQNLREKNRAYTRTNDHRMLKFCML